jgi:hypothetical protein
VAAGAAGDGPAEVTRCDGGAASAATAPADADGTAGGTVALSGAGSAYASAEAANARPIALGAVSMPERLLAAGAAACMAAAVTAD